MDKKIIIIITLVAFVLYGANATFANIDEDGFYVQSLTVDNTLEQENGTSINMSNKKFPKFVEETKQTENLYVLTPENVPQPYNPYAYNTNYVQYKKVIGPFYTTGFPIRQGYNYKGFGYNYTGHGYNYGYSVHNNKPIYVSQPRPLPPPPPHNIRPPMHSQQNIGGHHHPQNHKPHFKY